MSFAVNGLVYVETAPLNTVGQVFIKNHPGHGDQGGTNLSKLDPYTSNDEPLLMTLKKLASVAPLFLDEICLISLI